MFKPRFISLIIIACLTFFWSVACSPQSTPLAVSATPWSGYSGHHIAMKKDFYGQAGLRIQDILYQSTTEQVDAFLAGKTDLAWVTAGDVIDMAGKDPSLKIIFLCDYSNGADGIVGRGIKTAADLKGKTVARENVLFEKVFLRAYLEKGGLSEKDLKIKDMSAAAAAAAFNAQRVDAAVTYEPFLTKALKEGGGELLFSTKGTNLIADVLVTRSQLISDRRADLLTFLKAADKGIKLLEAGDESAIALAAQRLGTSSSELRAQLTGIALFDIEGNKTIGFNPQNPNNAIKNFELVAKAAYDFKVVQQPLDVKSIYDDSLVKAL